MLSLYLQAPPGVGSGNEENFKRRIEWLNNIGAVLQRVLSGAEARMWLVLALSSLEVSSDIQVDCFLDLLQNSMRDNAKENVHDRFELQFMRMLCSNRPRLAAKLLANDSGIFRRLFSGHPKRILQWFAKFAGVGQSDHQEGARALANYAFRNRDLCWHLLAWEGEHAQAPSTVAAKPHYFLELDVVNTILNFLEDEPEFWRSDELRDSLKDGAFLSIDISFFAEELLKKLASNMDNALDAWRVVKDYLREESFSMLCQQLLHVASDEKLLRFMNDLVSDLTHNYSKSWKRESGMAKSNSDRKIRSWMEVLAFSGVQWKSLKESMFCIACFNHGRNLWRILQEDEHEEDVNSLKQLFSEKCEDDGKQHWILRHKISKMEKTAACRYLALEAWALFYQLLVEPTAIDSFEALLAEIGIQYQPFSFSTEKVKVKDKKRRKKSSKRLRKRKHRKRELSDLEDRDEASQSDVEFSSTHRSYKDEQGWRLSIDDYTLMWTKADLAEYLTGYAVQQWLQWLCEIWH